jgi:hypothetical protein
MRTRTRPLPPLSLSAAKSRIAPPNHTALGRLASASALLGVLACDPEAAPLDDDDDGPIAGLADDGADGSHAFPVGVDDLGAGVRSEGHAKIPTIFGEREVTYKIIGGRAILEGDIDLGAVDAAGELMRPRGAVVDSLSLLWPNDVVPYTIDPSLTNQARVTNAIAILEANSGIDFRLRNGETDFVNFTVSTETDVSRSALGRQGSPQSITIWPDHSTQVVVHEMMHAIGFYHEQSRTDRDTYIDVHTECIRSGSSGEFAKATSSEALEPYDVTSIMHYGPDNFCKLVSATNQTCVCDTMTLDGGGSVPTWNNRPLSTNDINSLWRLYNHPIGANEANDGFGNALAHGDFDGDGYDDLAVGIPFEEVGTIRSGAVALFKGNSIGRLIPWRMLDASALGVLEEGDEFGWALAAGDFDNDGFVDLAIGAPGETDGTVAAGAVYIFEGSTAGLVPGAVLMQSTSPSLGLTESGDRFGATLAVGDFNADAKDDLAVGAVGEDNGTTADTGWVFTFKSTASGLVPWESLGQGSLSTNDASDRFGWSLATGYVNSDGYADLVIGSPEYGLGSGSVYVLKGGSTGMTHWKRLTQADSGGLLETQDDFGTAVAVGDFDEDGNHDIAIGAPGESVGSVSGAGQVYMYKGGLNSVTAWYNFGQSGLGADEAYDGFGGALAVGEVWNHGVYNAVDLIVGATGEDIESSGGTNAGAAFVFSGDDGGTSLTPRAVIMENGTIKLDSYGTNDPVSESYDFMGRAITVGDFNGDGDGDLVVGIPGEDDEAGAVAHFINYNHDNTFIYVTPIQQSIEQEPY